MRKLLVSLSVIVLLFLVGYFWYNGIPWINVHDKNTMVNSINKNHSEGSYKIVKESFDFKNWKYEIDVVYDDSPTIEHFYELRNSQLVEVWTYPKTSQ